jgi:hypothetical protein
VEKDEDIGGQFYLVKEIDYFFEDQASIALFTFHGQGSCFLPHNQ